MRSVGLAEIDVILITHAHADHVFGLPGMLKTFGMRDRSLPLTLVGPPGFKKDFTPLSRLIGRLPYALYIEEAEEGWVYDGPDYVIEACPTKHTVSSVGYRLWEDDRPGRFDVSRARDLGVPNGPLFGRLQHGEDVVLDDGTTVRSSDVVGTTRPGRLITYSGDTAPTDAFAEFTRQANVLVHEATFLEVDADRAAETGHSTALGAATLARDAEVDALVLTHLSTRYTVRDVRAEAQSQFPDAIIARDFDLITVPFPENGPITLEVRGARHGNHASPSRVDQAAL
jgi:ribonuclease Z